ncbi:ABC transporter ATP-binding protein [Candidatus Aerophobetes bacterium]|uniref:ABC transporter ATP-binding protein n=1 Tax=Aerophobetes bacterium TaxID=2030807 RepID=A0A523ZI09_UNCAE|nr:MAG: ABC transporter ATP-binding protein [Candidatus Aerophobetes bacterium]
MIRTQNLTKKYNEFKAVDNLSLEVKEGEIYGFLGPNGAGKTTTILMLLGILKPTQGEVYLFGQNITKDFLSIKKKMGVVSEKQYLYKEMTAGEYLNFFADLYGVKNRKKKIDQLLEAVNLLEVRNRKLGAFSRGMQQKLGFARALLHDPQLLLLDEPVSGLDPTGIKQIRDLIEQENKKGRTIFISSHLLSEVERLCGKVGIINKGRLLAEDTMDNLRKRLTDVVELEIELTEAKKEIIDTLAAFDFTKGLKREENLLTIKVKADKDYRAQISEAISQQGGVVLGIKKKEMSLEEAFITITEKNISLLTEKEKEAAE